MSKKAAAKKSKAATPAAAGESGGPIAPRDVTMDMFKKHVGSPFTTSLFGGIDDEGVEHPPYVVELTLVACDKARGERGGDGVSHPEIVKRDPFVIRFQGPDHFPFPDQMYTFSHEKLGTIQGVSMSMERCEADRKTWMSAHFL